MNKSFERNITLLFQLLFFLVEKENTILHDGGKSNIWILDKHSFSNRLLNEACGILLFVKKKKNLTIKISG